MKYLLWGFALLSFTACSDSNPTQSTSLSDSTATTASKSSPLVLSNLIVEPGQVLNIPPREYKHDTIHIKEGGLLKVNDNGSKWLVLNAKVLICEGSIEYRNVRRGVGKIEFAFQSGEKIDHTYDEGLGGSGGSGAANGRQQGGLGFRPTDYNGGGGGSGAYYIGTPRQNVPGMAATDFRGAPSPGLAHMSFGGNGARQPYGHGGLVCIVADKVTFGKLARIELSGTNGIDGSPAGGGDCYGGGQVYYWGGGGGGGGTAGGNGGVLKVMSSDVTNMPVVNVRPGRGGRGGNGGPGGRCSYQGQDGMKGDDGEQGYADWQ